MNSDHQPHFIARRLEDYKKATQRPLSCHLCTAAAHFRGEKDFLEHVRQIHPETATDAPNGPAWKHAVQTAAAKAKGRPTTRRLPIEQPSFSRRSSTDSMKLNYGDGDIRSGSIPSRPVSAQLSKTSEPKISEFKRLSIENTAPGPIRPVSIPQKRSAGLHALPDARNRGDKVSSSKTQRTRGLSAGHDSDFDRGTQSSARKLFDPTTDNASFGRSNSPYTSRSQELRGHSHRPHRDTGLRDNRNPQSAIGSRASRHSAGALRAIPIQIDEEAARADNWDEEEPELLLQPETTAISQEQLVHEVKGIYTGLCMVEQKAIDVDEQQLKIAKDPDPAQRKELKAEQWLALIALHKTLLHEHHDFFLASQHPAADSTLSSLGQKHSMPGRMWKHGINTFLEVLRYHLPGSEDFMLTFLNISYSMMALLYETVPTYQDTWIECLGDLGRYRLGMPGNDMYDQDVWASVARYWYLKRLDQQPETGRLLHYLGILEKPHSIIQLSLFCRATTSWTGLEKTRANLMELFNPVLAGQLNRQIRPKTIDTLIIACLGELYTGRSTQEYAKHYHLIIDQGSLSKYIDRAGIKFKEVGVSICISVLAGLLEFGATRPSPSTTSRSIIRRVLDEEHKKENPNIPPYLISDTPEYDSGPLTDDELELSINSITHASKLAFGVFRVALEKLTDRNIIPMIHVFIAFLKTVAGMEAIMEQIEMDVPWNALVGYLNHYTNAGTITQTCLASEFPKPPEEAVGRPLPEDFIMRGLIEFYNYFPTNWFQEADVEDEEKSLELPSMATPRLCRILWGGIRLANHNKWISYNPLTFKFATTDYGKALTPRSLPSHFMPGIISGDLQNLVPPVPQDSLVIDTSKVAMESGSPKTEVSETPNSLRETPLRTPQILKRENRAETDILSPASALPSRKTVQIADPNRMDIVSILQPDET